jgi:nucleotide-binding universal stress UspA family protein
MFNHLLVLLDGSKLAEVVFSYAEELSARMNINNLELLHVCSPQEAEQLAMREAYMAQMAELLQKKAAEIRAKSRGGTTGERIQVQGKVVVGYPAEEILRYADQNQVDLIMLSTHGRSGIKIWDLGSVASKVIHAAKVPIWLVPAELREEVLYDKFPRRPLVVPLDGSPFSESVIPYALDIARQRAAETEIVFVFVEVYQGIVPNYQSMETREAERVAIRKYLDDRVQSIQAAGLAARAEILPAGKSDPAREIVKYIDNNPTQLVAMATHGHAGIDKMIFSSVAENILNLVKKTPIFLVRPPGLK